MNVLTTCNDDSPGICPPATAAVIAVCRWLNTADEVHMVTTADKFGPPTADGTVGDWLFWLVANNVAPLSAVFWTVNGGGGVLLQV